jgi:DNA-binding transcriptional LysR family regulator
MFDWSDLRHFLAVHRSGSLAKAGRELRVDQTTVGRRVAQLEQGLGAKLFDRLPDGLRLTEAGRDVLCIAERLEAEALALERLVRGRDVNPEGVVRLTTSETLGSRFVAPRLGRIRSKYPGVRIEIVTDVRNFNLSRREADIAIRIGVTEQEGLVVKKVADVGFALYGAKSYLARRAPPTSLEDLRSHDLLGYEEGLVATPEERWMAAAAGGTPFVIRSNSTNLLYATIRDGQGIGMLPCWLGDPDDTLERLLPGEAYVPRPLSLVIHEDVRRVARTRLVLDALDALFAAERATLAGRRAGGEAPA